MVLDGTFYDMVTCLFLSLGGLIFLVNVVEGTYRRNRRRL